MGGGLCSSDQLIQPLGIGRSDGTQATLCHLQGGWSVMSTAFEMSLQGQAEHHLHALWVILMAAKMAEAEPLRLKAHPWRIEGMDW